MCKVLDHSAQFICDIWLVDALDPWGGRQALAS
jgi:hypothetical protein